MFYIGADFIEEKLTRVTDYVDETESYLEHETWTRFPCGCSAVTDYTTAHIYKRFACVDHREGHNHTLLKGETE